jgi:wyosine [tRNA(Phe)-imidazoG37] synthetase (radical SAM superfamily)
MNPDKGCNFDCIYCQVDRTPEGMAHIQKIHQKVDPDRVIAELSHLIDLVETNQFFSVPPFDQTPMAQRILTDVSFSGDGEPTMVPEFPEVLEKVLAFFQKRTHEVTIRIITNGTGLFKASTRRKVLDLFKQKNTLESERIPWSIWFKIDAADAESFAFLDRSGLRFPSYWKQVEETLQETPVTIQTMVMDYISPTVSFHPEGDWSKHMQQAMGKLVAGGAKISRWDLYSVARMPPSPEVRPVSYERLLALSKFFNESIPLPIHIFP